MFCHFYLNSKIILIDEIGNGLHHTLYEKVWKMIFQLAKEKKIQVFITAHNKEVLQSLNTFLEENEDYQNLFSHHLLTNNKGRNAVYSHSYDEFQGTLSSSVDVRDE